MPQARDVTVSLYPAAERGGFITTTFGFGEETPRLDFQAATAKEIIAEAKRFAEGHGKPCAVSIRIRNGQRKPPHFDAACDAFRFANLPSQIAAAAKSDESKVAAGHSGGDHSACEPFDCAIAERSAVTKFLSAPRKPGEEDNRDLLRGILAEEGFTHLAQIRPAPTSSADDAQSAGVAS